MKPTVFVSGVFDCFHAGHKYLLKSAAEYGSVFVAVNDDAYVRRIKGEGRPIDKATKRAANVIDSGYVDMVCINDADSPLELIVALKPKFLVVGSDYQIKDIVGLAESKIWGGATAVIVPRVFGISTSQIIADSKRTIVK